MSDNENEKDDLFEKRIQKSIFTVDEYTNSFDRKETGTIQLKLDALRFIDQKSLSRILKYLKNHERHTPKVIVKIEIELCMPRQSWKFIKMLDILNKRLGQLTALELYISFSPISQEDKTIINILSNPIFQTFLRKHHFEFISFDCINS